MLKEQLLTLADRLSKTRQHLDDNTRYYSRATLDEYFDTLAHNQIAIDEGVEMKLGYSVTFEFDEAKPETVRGAVIATEASGAIRKAVKAAKAQKPGVRWRSLVVVLERQDETEAVCAA